MTKSSVLIAHHDAATRSRLRRRLESGGRVRTIVECESGADALHCIEVFRPTVVFLGATLPDLTAAEIVTWLLPEERPSRLYILGLDFPRRDFRGHQIARELLTADPSLRSG